MKQTLHFVLFIIVFASASIKAEEFKPQRAFEQANKLYYSKDYLTSIELYKEIINNGYESAELYYNLGNSYYRTGRLGFAVLYYEKALKLSPKDEDIKHNLDLANLRTIDRIETLPEFFIFSWWEWLLNSFMLKEWAILALFIYFVVLSAAAVYFFASSVSWQKTGLISGMVSFAVLLITVSVLVIKYNREVNEIKGIIISNEAAVKLAPEESSDDAFIIHEGLKLKIEDKLNNWLKIRLEDGKMGWIKDRELEVI